MTQIIETDIVNDDIDIHELEKEFSEFIKDVEFTTSRISSDINMDELAEVGDEILKAREYLVGFAKGEKKSIREKAYNQISNIPLLGNYAKKKIEEAQVQHLKDSSVKEVLNGIFKRFDDKKKRLLELSESADEIRTQLIKQEKELGSYIIKLEKIISKTDRAGIKMRALDMSIQAQSQDAVVKDQIHNKLTFILELMENLMTKMAKALPALKSQLLTETSIAGMITNMSDSVKMMNTLQDLTNEIAVVSTANIHNLILDVTNNMSRTSDIEHARKFMENNAKHQETMKHARVKYIETTVANYDALKGMSTDMNLQLENRLKAESEALSISFNKPIKSE